MRRVILYIAMSLDGFIAGPNDDLSFLHEYDGHELVKKSYDDFIAHVDTILLGRKTYDWVIKNAEDWPYEGFNTYVFTHHPVEIKHGVMTNQQPKDVLLELKQKPGKDIFLIGGGKLVQSMLEDDLVDEMIIAIIPQLLGFGTKLFEGNKSSWNVTNLEEEKGLVFITYTRKNGLV